VDVELYVSGLIYIHEGFHHECLGIEDEKKL